MDVCARWSVKAEYLYIDLGSFSTTGVDLANTALTINFNHRLTETAGVIDYYRHTGGIVRDERER